MLNAPYVDNALAANTLLVVLGVESFMRNVSVQNGGAAVNELGEKSEEREITFMHSNKRYSSLPFTGEKVVHRDCKFPDVWTYYSAYEYAKEEPDIQNEVDWEYLEYDDY